MENQEENLEENLWSGNDDCAGQPVPLNPPEGANPNGKYECVNGVLKWIEYLGE